MKKISIISTYPPQKCGVANFTAHLRTGMELDPEIKIDLIAVAKLGEQIFGPAVRYIIDRDRIDGYIQAANLINEEYDCCILQHDFTIFGGIDGLFIQQLINKLTIPLVTVFHTLMENPSLQQQEIMELLLHKSQYAISLSRQGGNLLKRLCPQVADQNIKVIPQGITAYTYNRRLAKYRLGLQNNFVLMTFGLIGKRKGLENAIRSLAHLRIPNLKYLIVGKTHPDVLLKEGESYRYKLKGLVAQLGLEDQVVFIDETLNEHQINLYLSSCDIYLSPYQLDQQISGGSLAYAVGAGVPIIATPHWHAQELLEDERGVLTDFDNVNVLRHHIHTLYKSGRRASTYRHNTQQYVKRHNWRTVAQTYVDLLSDLTTPIHTMGEINLFSPFDLKQEA